jgi:predicted nucleotide-binding protein
MLEGLIARLEERKSDLIAKPKATASHNTNIKFDNNRRVFVVHGHDEVAKQAVARFLQTLECEPIVLSEQPNQGRTIIEKFEKHADVAFAVVLLTPDDTGYKKNHMEQMKDRARQNAILELGYFVGKLSRERVCALHKGSIDIPSDLHGIVYIPMDDGDGWKLTLAKELKAAGIKVDLNLL